MSEASARVRREHFDILQRSGILNPDLTLEKLISVAAELDASFGDDLEVSVPTLVGPFYVYHALEQLGEDIL